jgi:O-antigen/teichoic acid export membrane protein
MSNYKIIATNASYLMVAQLVSMVFSILLGIFIARKMGSVEFGKYSFAIAFTAIFGVFSDLGYNTLLLREVSKDKQKVAKYASNLLSIYAISNLLIFFIIIATINILSYPPYMQLVVSLFAISVLWGSFSTLFKDIFRSFEQMKYEASVNIAINIVRCSFGLAILFLGYGLIALALVYVFSGFLDFILSYLICRENFIKPRFELDINFFKGTIASALALCLLPFLGIILARADTIMLSTMDGDYAVGLYNAAYNIVRDFRFIPVILLNALFPTALSIYEKSKGDFHNYYSKAISYLLVVSIPMTVGLFLLSEEIILFAYGSQYLGSTDTLKIVALDIPLFCIFIALGNAFISMGKERLVAISVAISAIFNICLNLILIPKFSFNGAAVATDLSEFLLAIIYLIFMQRYLWAVPIHRFLIKPITASIPMFIFIIISKHFAINLFIIIFFSIIIYGYMFIRMGGLDNEEKIKAHCIYLGAKTKIFRILSKMAPKFLIP